MEAFLKAIGNKEQSIFFKLIFLCLFFPGEKQGATALPGKLFGASQAYLYIHRHNAFISN